VLIFRNYVESQILQFAQKPNNCRWDYVDSDINSDTKPISPPQEQ